jgi:agmatinase
MSKALREVNAGSVELNQWVYEQCAGLLAKEKLVILLGGDHSTMLGYAKALAGKYPSFGILQIDAHCDLREAYEGFVYSHASVMHNVLKEIPQIEKLVQIGVRDYTNCEKDFIDTNPSRVVTFFDKDIKEKMYDNHSWKNITEAIIAQLPDYVYVSFDIDGLDPKLCSHTGTPVMGGFQTEEIFYLLRKMIQSGKKIIGFDLVEVGVSHREWDENVGARVLYKLCNLLLLSSPQ